MRELILNHASVYTTRINNPEALDWFKDVIEGIASIVGSGIAEKHLRMDKSLYEMSLGPHGQTLYDLVLELQGKGYRDEYRFFVGLAAKVPLLNELEEDIRDRFRACEEQTLAKGDGDPLVLCAISDGIAVGFPSQEIWDSDRLDVRFCELLQNDTLNETVEVIDQLTRAVHAVEIIDRHRSRLSAAIDPRDLWRRRKEIFPNLVFGLDVESNLITAAAHFSTIIAKLSDLDASAGEWKAKKRGPAPNWKTYVSPESSHSMRNRDFRQSRTFRSYHGGNRIFEWHARYGSSGRIHLYFDANHFEVEIGYIGSHLPL